METFFLTKIKFERNQSMFYKANRLIYKKNQQGYNTAYNIVYSA